MNKYINLRKECYVKISLNTVAPIKQNISLANKNINTVQVNETQKSNNPLATLDYSALVNKSNMNAKNNVSFRGICLIDKNAWNTLSRNQKVNFWVESRAFFGLDKPFRGKGGFIFHEDLDRLKTRVEFVNEHFNEHYDHYVPAPFSGDTYYYDCVEDIRVCFCDHDADEEKKRLDFAAFLKNKPDNKYDYNRAEDISKGIGREIAAIIFDNKIDDNAVTIAKTNFKTFKMMSSLDSGVLSHIKRVGYSMQEVYKATLQHINKEELSDEQLDLLADFKLAVEAYDNFQNKKATFFNDLFSDLNLDKKVKTHTVLINPDLTKAQVVKTKFSTYYKVTNGTKNLFLSNSDPKFRTEVNAAKAKTHYDYKIPFPAGNWLPATRIEIDNWRESACRCDKPFNLFVPAPLKSISLPAKGSVFFEKVDKEELKIDN